MGATVSWDGREISSFDVHCLENLVLQSRFTWGVQAVKFPNFFSGMEADRNVKVVGGDVALL